MQIGACALAAGLATLSLQGRHEPAAPTPASEIAAMIPPVIDARSGKILDRADGSIGEDVRAPGAPVNSLLRFAGGLDLPGSVVAASDHRQPASAAPQQLAESAAPRSAGRASVARARATVVAETAPLPPPRPAEAQPAIVVAEATEKKDESLLGRVLPAGMGPSRLLPAGREAWSRMATLGESLVDRLVP